MPQDNSKPISSELLTLNNAVMIQAIINLLQKKGILTELEVKNEVRKLKDDIDKQIRNN